MAAEVEAVAVADLGLGQAADLVLGLEDDDRDAAAGEEVAGGQSRGAAAEHGDGLADLALVSARSRDRGLSNSTVDMAPTFARRRGRSRRFLKTANSP